MAAFNFMVRRNLMGISDPLEGAVLAQRLLEKKKVTFSFEKVEFYRLLKENKAADRTADILFVLFCSLGLTLSMLIA